MNTPGSVPMARWLEDVWLSRYLDRELNDDEQAWFEAYMLDKPQLLEQVDADTRLRDGLRQETLSKRMQTDSTLKESAPKHASTRGSKSIWLGLAASLGIGFVVGQLLPLQSADDMEVLASPKRVVFDSFRGEGATTFTEPGADNSPYLIVEMALPVTSTVLAADAFFDGNPQTIR
jgi:anti-sigma factor RsiW